MWRRIVSVFLNDKDDNKCVYIAADRAGKCLLNDPISMYLPEFEKMKVSDGIITHQTVYA